MANYIQVGEHFVKFYYEKFSTNRDELTAVYRDASMLSWENITFEGAKGIVDKLKDLPLAVKFQLISIDSQPSVNDGVLVFVLGDLAIENNNPMKFTHVFHLQKSPEGGFFGESVELSYRCIIAPVVPYPVLMYCARHPSQTASRACLMFPKLVLYGSQTGTAREASADIARCFSVRDQYFECRWMSIDYFWRSHGSRIAQDEEKYVIFVVSTTGQGDVPANMRQFWAAILLSSLSKNFLEKWQTAIFGIGDRRYAQFNYGARKLRTRLKQLGAREFYRMGLGDEQHDFGYEGEFDPWLEGLLNCIDSKVIPLDEKGYFDLDSNRNKPEFIVAIVGNEQQVTTLNLLEPFLSPKPQSWCGIAPATTVVSTVRYSERLTPMNHFQHVHHLQISLPSNIQLYPGDCISVHPVIDSTIVLQFIQETLQLSPSIRVTVQISPASIRETSPFPIDSNGQPVPLTLFEIFSYFLDISSVPGRHFFRVLSQYSDDLQHRDKLLEFAGSSPESKDAYYEYCKLERRTIAEILWDFDSCRSIPLDQLFSIIPFIEPRKYTAASTKLWYSRSLWWTLGCPVLVQSPILWGFASPFCMQLGLKKVSWKQKLIMKLFGVQSPNMRFVDQLIRKWRHLDVEVYWKPVFQKRLQRYQCTVKDDDCVDQLGNEFAVDLCIAVAQYKTKLQRDKVGLCSGYLRSLQPGDKITVTVEPGTGIGAHWQPALESPLLLVSPGTGLTPCRALIQERFLQCQRIACSIAETKRCSSGQGHPLVGSITLVLGFRHPEKDFLYQQDWDYFSQHVKKKRSLIKDLLSRKKTAPALIPWNFRLITAYSRYWPDKVVYVQDALEQYSKQIANVLSDQQLLPPSTMMISGKSTPMPLQVIRACQDILKSEIGLSDQQATNYMEDMRRTKRLFFDTWG